MKNPSKKAGKSRARVSRSGRPGMTLMEVVIAIAVVAFVVPLILAATGSAGSSRRSAEADTRSAWIARQVQQELIVSWGEHPEKSVFGTSLPFPKFPDVAEPEKTPEILLFDSDGEFIAKGSGADLESASQVKDATYIVAAYSEEYNPPNLPAIANSLCILHIRIIHPAKANPGNRSTFRYNLITTKQGTL